MILSRERKFLYPRETATYLLVSYYFLLHRLTQPKGNCNTLPDFKVQILVRASAFAIRETSKFSINLSMRTLIAEFQQLLCSPNLQTRPRVCTVQCAGGGAQAQICLNWHCVCSLHIHAHERENHKHAGEAGQWPCVMIENIPKSGCAATRPDFGTF